ncbi:MAG TPA: NADH-quinone oxidoreductase subunit NuoH [Bryobacteraceae bacterium]|jgi:NADH-quinone oxidoreductase subunit H|nr:NADH-quinone oxidoreductase subunit NuoH [Bryobacteraceae bacterium]
MDFLQNFLILSLIKVAVIAFVLLTTLAYLQWIERKVIGHIQLRVGPYRVGPHGLLQPLADVVKLITKEGVLPSHVNKFFYLLAPFIAVVLALISIAVIPFGPQITIGRVTTWMQLTDLNIGILFVLAVSSVGVYGVALGGWASNNKYSLLGGLRSSAQMISYELPLALAIAAPLLLANTLSFREMVDYQSGYWLGFIPRWNVFPEIVGFVIFVIAGFAETNRVPFDLPEAENELVAGFHTEYSSMSFAAFFMAEYANMVTVTAVATLLFLGGWQPPFPEPYSNFIPILIFVFGGLIAVFHGLHPARRMDKFTLPAAGLVFLGIAALFGLSLFVPVLKTILMALFWFCGKVGLLLFLFIWVRGTLPRFRYDQLMRFAWIVLFPLAIVNLLATGLVVALTSK